MVNQYTVGKEHGMKSDAQLQSEIQVEINAHPKIAEPGQIGVAVHHGVVTLTGRVERPACKWEAERAAWRVEGVRAVAEEIETKTSEDVPSDAEVADAVATLLEWSAELDAKDLRARVENGWVMLEGSVPRPAESRAAERLTSQVRGVKGVSNRIRVARKGAELTSAEALGTEEAVGWRPVDDEC
jgi:hyperosmotically inducible protein